MGTESRAPTAKQTKPSTSAIPVNTTRGSADRASLSRRVIVRGIVTAATPTRRGGRTAQPTGSDALRCPVAKIPTPNDSAASAASQNPPDLRRSGVDSSGATPASTMPSVTIARSTAEARPRVSPAATASTAAMAPSVEVTGVTMPTLPRRSAEYSRSNPAALPRPDTSIHAMSVAPRGPGAGPTAIMARFATSPKSITQATTDAAPMMRLERAEQKVPAPHAVSYTHLRAHETDSYLVCRLLLEK